MRIVGGDLKGRKFEAPEGRDIRPTSDRVREAVFNLLLHGKNAVAMDGAVVVDVYAGTGALGFEALSRGAAHVVLMDNAKASIKCLRRNCLGLGVSDRVTLIEADARYLPPPPPPVAERGANIVFIDPPYHQGLVGQSLNRLVETGWIAADGIVVAEMETDGELESPAELTILHTRTYGAARVVILTLSRLLK